MALSKESILSSADRETRTEHVKEWGDDVILRTLTAADRNAYDKSNLKQDGDNFEYDSTNIWARLLVRCIVDEDNNRVFADGDAVELGKKSAAVLGRLFDVAQEMNGLGQKAVDDAKGNSDAAPSGDSSSV